MKLSEKGTFLPRPPLEGPAEDVACAVEKWTDVHARTHWELGDESVVDGADFYLGERELGHIHLYAEAHVALPRPLADAVIAAKLALPFRWSASFVVKKIRSATDAEVAERLFALAYAHLRGETADALMAQLASGGAARPSSAGRTPRDHRAAPPR